MQTFEHEDNRGEPSVMLPGADVPSRASLSGELLRRVKALRATVRGARELGRRVRLEIWRLQGRERASGKPLAVLFRGQLENMNYLRELVYGGRCRETAYGVWCWRFERVIRDPRAGHALAVVERTQLPPAVPPGTFYIPCWIGGEIDLATVARRRRISDNVKADLRRVSKNGFDYTIERARDAILRFYDGMYLPYIRAVYGGRAYVERRADLEARIERTELLLVRQHGQPVAGQVMRYEPDGVYGWLLGVKDADRGYVRDGAVAAIYHFTLRYLAEKGFARIHVGESRPFLNDGVLRYKAKWGVRLTPGTPKWFALTLVRPSSAAAAFLANNPFIYETAGRLYGALFRPMSPAMPPARELDALKLDGITGITMFRGVGRSDAGGWNAGAVRRWDGMNAE